MDDGIHSDTSEGLSVWGSPDFLVGPERACFKLSAQDSATISVLAVAVVGDPAEISLGGRQP